ncbi:MAG: 1,4-alpha-glucan branching protein GlgB [Lachnospiraceae bacterium]|nr:1,4-alpha-glucan branching protein GlgB [Lachnospiraceae bacterium]MCI9096935.1 1,4-alpha-glucan branching protein GlgB [Lachnospiraceae bacterium]MCI9203375.1 1,4-alpha-glucan branching protein GlgB [Lachnospiraceae bacterium]
MNNRLYKLMNWPRIEGIIYSEEDRPHEILGPHIVGKSVLFQTFQPGAGKVSLITEDGKKTEMEMVDEAGYFAALVAGKIPDRYEYEICRGEETVLQKDAYRYQTGLSAKDIEKFNAGIHYTIYEKLGAHFMTIDGTEGTFFAVWAPNALRVSVVGDFNHWDGRLHQMTRNPEGGIFEIFIPDVKPGECYKFELKVKGGLTYLKADPYAFGQQLRPDTASVVRDFQYVWKDGKWMKDREKRQQENAPVSVYEMYLGSFKRNRETNDYLNYRELAPEIAKYAKEMGYTHVELMPVMEHPLDASWGYQVIGYYAPTARYGTAEDFMFLVDTLHQAGIGVILDWVPAHFPRDTYGLSQFDGTGLYEHADPRQGSHPHWGTLIYNYGRPQVSNYLIANALYWVEKYHVDGIRMDAVASMLYLDYGKQEGQWVANIYGGNENLEAMELLKHLNSVMKKRNPGVLMIAEESTAWPKITSKVEEDGLGFDLKWNMGFMNDFLSYIGYDPYFRAHHHNELTFSMVYAYSENFMLVFSHDEVVHGKATLIGKMPGVIEDKFANLRLTYAYMMTHPGKKLLFMGQDIAEFKEFDETRETEWGLLSYEPHKGVHQLVKDLNALYKEKPALYAMDTRPEGFEWINCISPEKCMVSFLRKTDKIKETLVVVANFANLEQEFTIGVPYEGKYKEVLNTDAKCYGGLGRVNGQAVFVEEEETDAKPYSFKMTSAPLSVSIFSYVPYTAKEKQMIAKKKARLEAEAKAEKARLEAEQAKADALKAKEEAERAMRQAAEAEARAKEAEKRAEKEIQKAREELSKAEEIRREEEICSQAAKAK